MFRKIGLDIGSKSCGIALSDPLGITAQGKENFKFEEHDWETLLKHLESYFVEYQIDKIIIGYPTLPSGDKSKTTLMIEDVAKLIGDKFKLEVIFIDENHTTSRAHEVMISAGMTREKRKLHKDKIAAQLILEDYLSRL